MNPTQKQFSLNRGASRKQIPISNEFSPYVVEQISWYVYALQDPRDRKIFYIGKGKGNRVFAHAIDARAEGLSEVSQKIELIQAIHQAGKEVNTFIVRHGIPTEEQAYMVESALIDLCYLLDPNVDNSLFQIKNIVKGHHYQDLGTMTTGSINALYDAEDCPEITEAVMLFKIPVRWFPQMTNEELFESTHGWWRAGQRREKAKYAMAVSAGVIRGIYRIDNWRLRVEGDRGFQKDEKSRFGFSGVSTTDLDKYLNKSVKHLYKRGEQTPFKYINEPRSVQKANSYKGVSS